METFFLELPYLFYKNVSRACLARLRTSALLFLLLCAPASHSVPAWGANAQALTNSQFRAQLATSGTRPAIVSPYTVVSRGPHHRVWQGVTVQTNAQGAAVYRTNSYTEMQTGMHVWRNSQWQDADETIQIVPGGAVATNGQHQVAVSADINNTNGSVDLLTPDGQHMRSSILGLAYFDSSTGTNVLIAQVQSSIGQLLPSGNQVLYTNALSGDVQGVNVLYTYRKSGLQQDVVFTQAQSLPDPTAYGMNSQSTMVQVITQFLEAPTPQVSSSSVSQDSGLTNQDLDFGVMKMPRGRAFSIGTNNAAVPVSKHWAVINGYTFLFEELPLNSIAPQLSQLPAVSSPPAGPGATPSSGGSSSLAPRAARQWVGNPLPQALTSLATRKLPARSARPMKIASSQFSPQGFVWDYDILNGSITNWVLAANRTYFVSDSFYIYGTCDIQGGTTVKYAPDSNASIIINSPTNMICETGPHNVATFTAQDDDTSGEPLYFSSGTPIGYYGGAAIQINGGREFVLRNLRFRFQQTALQINNTKDNYLYDMQFLNCGTALNLYSSILNVENALFANVSTDLYCALYVDAYIPIITMENITVDGGDWFCDVAGTEDWTADYWAAADAPFCLTVNNGLIAGTPTIMGNNISGFPNGLSGVVFNNFTANNRLIHQ